MNFFIVILVIISILLSAFGQILLKKGAQYPIVHGRIPQQLIPYLNQYSILGYGLLFLVTILSVYILIEMPLKVFFPLFISGNLITIVVFSYLFLRESITHREIIGIWLIISGILIFFL